MSVNSSKQVKIAKTNEHLDKTSYISKYDFIKNQGNFTFFFNFFYIFAGAIKNFKSFTHTENIKKHIIVK